MLVVLLLFELWKTESRSLGVLESSAECGLVVMNDVKVQRFGRLSSLSSDLFPSRGLACSRSEARRVILPSSFPLSCEPRTTIRAKHNNDTIMVLVLLARLMAPPTQTLRTLQPTPSTVSFTVSTRPVPATVAAKLSYYVGLLTRLMLGACVLLLLWTKWRISYGQSTDTLLFLLGGPQTAALLKGVGGLWWGYVGPGAIMVLYLVLRRGYTGTFTSESAFSTRTNTT